MPRSWKDDTESPPSGVQPELNAALDSQDREQALRLLEAAGRYDPFSPDRPLQPAADLELEDGLQSVTSSLRQREQQLPAEDNKQSLDDLSPLPALQFETNGLVEQTVLTSLQCTLGEARETAGMDLSAGRRQAAIDAMRRELNAFAGN